MKTTLDTGINMTNKQLIYNVSLKSWGNNNIKKNLLHIRLNTIKHLSFIVLQTFSLLPMTFVFVDSITVQQINTLCYDIYTYSVRKHVIFFAVFIRNSAISQM